jgi:hypothetical protein
MPSFLSRWSNADDQPLRRRATALAITLFVHLLLLYMLLRLAPETFAPMGAVGSLKTFSVTPGPEPQQATQKAAAKPAAAAPPKAATPPPTPANPPPPIVKMPTPLKMPDNFIELSRSDVAQVDKAINTPGEAKPGQATAAAGGGEGDTPSTMGSNGQLLYAAEWYRRPTDAELSAYMPHRQVPEGSWGEIACRTVARFHVEDCQELGDSFPGIGIARGMRQAAFQFLVRPPRVNGRLMVGTWVRIRITLSEHPVNRDDP